MRIDRTIEQAIYGGQAAGGYQFLAQSPGFLPEWFVEAQRLCTGLGERPPGIACPASVYCKPFGTKHFAVVQAGDQGTDFEGRPGALAFRLLIVPLSLYREIDCDPFLIAERFPPPWHERRELPALEWPPDDRPGRTVQEVQEILKSENGPLLLGAVQALVDGGRIAIQKPAPDTPLLKDLWQLLPSSTRAELSPASFAFGNALHFDVMIAPRVDGADFAGYLSAEQAADYPQGRYELGVQTAAEAGDQAQLDVLFNRRSRRETWRLGFLLLAALAIIALVAKFLLLEEKPKPEAANAVTARPALPPEDRYVELTLLERKRLKDALFRLAEDLGMERLPRMYSSEKLVSVIAEQLGTPDPARDPTRDLVSGPVERRLRALLWKHHVESYADPRLNVVELVEHLRKSLAADIRR